MLSTMQFKVKRLSSLLFIAASQENTYNCQEQSIPRRIGRSGNEILRFAYLSLLACTLVFLMVPLKPSKYNRKGSTKVGHEPTVPITSDFDNVTSVSKSTSRNHRTISSAKNGTEAYKGAFQNAVSRKEATTAQPRSATSATSLSGPVTLNATVTSTVPRILLVAYFRSGSSFLGAALSQNPLTFYHFEPLSVLHNDHTKPAQITSLSYKTIQNIFRCDFEHVPEYIKQAKSFSHYFTRNRALWSRCRGHINVCFRPEVISTICNMSRMQLMKVTLLRLRDVRELIRNYDDLGRSIKVIHLVRDPRGIWASRLREAWCTYAMGCKNIQTLCQEMRDDIDTFDELKIILQSRITRVRYEDIALNPVSGMKSLLNRLGLSFTRHVSRFLKTHAFASETKTNNSFSIRRNSNETAFRWTHWLDYREVVKIQETCPDVFRSLGYPIAHSEVQLKTEIEKAFRTRSDREGM
uniref:Putative secreted protein n=1 Tax=Ixodes ricinus TaxID=34613 RepID=A0A0K8R4A2_IXORI